MKIYLNLGVKKQSHFPSKNTPTYQSIQQSKTPNSQNYKNLKNLVPTQKQS